MHHIYHTRGLILSSRNIGESSIMYAFYTREMGLIKAVAQGVKKPVKAKPAFFEGGDDGLAPVKRKK